MQLVNIYNSNNCFVFMITVPTATKAIMSTTSSPSAVPHCGVYCNASVVINPWTSSDVFQWESENWGIGDYPEDCICTLNVQVGSVFVVGYV